MEQSRLVKGQVVDHIYICGAVFLSGVAQHCELSFVTGSDTVIPGGAPVRLVASSDITVEFPHPPARLAVGQDGENTVHQFTLPAVPAESSHDCHVILTVPAVKHVRMTLSESQDTTDQLSAWKHQVRYYPDPSPSHCTV